MTLLWKAVVLEVEVKAHPQKFWFAENLAKSLKIRVKIAPNVAWFKKMVPKVCRKNTWRPFQEATPKKVLDLCGRKFAGERCTNNFSGKLGDMRAKILRAKNRIPKMCLLLHLWWKGTCAPLPPFLKGQREKCPRHASILRRPCVYYSTRTLFTRCCKLQSVTVMNKLLSAVSLDRAVDNCKNMRQRVKTGE